MRDDILRDADLQHAPRLFDENTAPHEIRADIRLLSSLMCDDAAIIAFEARHDTSALHFAEDGTRLIRRAAAMRARDKTIYGVDEHCHFL